MNSQILPKKRGQNPPNGGSSRVSSLHDLSNKGRAISGRSLSKSKRVASGSRHVSRGDLFTRPDEDAIHFDENKHTILSNFEEWIKLSTDNKITSKNSWQFALIDYFHDLNVIKDGENINFQRASATLDGCVKIYSSRVESVASETGKLLSGLATKKNQNADGEDDDEEDDENNEANDEANDSTAGENDGRKKRKINRILESTLVDFDTIRIKKLDQELAIDPLFKKALAEFDEGGAKSLLLNTLNIDNSGRVVFDATTNKAKEGDDELSDDNEEVEEKNADDNEDEGVNSQPNGHGDADIDFDGLQTFLYKDSAEELDSVTICPSLKELKVVLKDVNKAKSLLSDVNNKFIQDDDRLSNAADTPSNLGDYDQFGFDNYDDGNFGEDNELDENAEAGSAFNSTIYDGIARLFQGADEYGEEVMQTKVLDQDLMAYFDERMKTNWRGPEHWKVTNLKKAKNHIENNTTKASDEPIKNDEMADPMANIATKKKKKEDVIVNFLDFEIDDDNEDEIFQKPKNMSMLLIKSLDRANESKNMLPEDIQFNSKKLTNLFGKKHKSISHFTRKTKDDYKAENNENEPQLTDENYFSKQYQKEEEERRQQEQLAASFQQAEYEDYDNDDFGDINFNDALESNANEVNGEVKSEEEPGTQLLTGGRKARPEYVNFSRVAKRVDVRLLKDNLWKSISKVEDDEWKKHNQEEKEEEAAIEDQPVKTEKKFADVITSIGNMYKPEERKDLSTSFCFICLLHLANEHSLDITSTAAHDDLRITGF